MAKQRAVGVRQWHGKWQARVSINAKMSTRAFDTYVEAVAWRNKQIEQALKGRPGDPASLRTPMGAHWAQWRAGTMKRPNTMARYDSAWRTYIEDRWARVQLGRLTRADAQVWVKELVASGLSPASVRKVVQITSTCIQQAVRDEILDRNPFRNLDLPELPDDEAHFMTSDEAKAVEAAMDPWWRLTVPFAMDTGLRLSELCGVRVRDIEFHGRTWAVQVRQIVTEPHGHLTIGPPKTSAGIRTVPTITPEVASRVAAHIAERNLGPDDHLFQGSRGGVMRPVNWRARIFRPAVEKADDQGHLEEGELIVPHSMRHGAVALWIASGVSNEYQLSKWLGHANPRTVTQQYGHLIVEDTTWLTDKLSAFREQAANKDQSTVHDIGDLQARRRGEQ